MDMKKIYSPFTSLALIAAMSLSSPVATAQESTTSTSVSVSEETMFNPHWFIQLQGGAGYTIGENDFKKLLSPAAALNVGYRFTPSFGLRAGGSGWQAKGALVSPRAGYKFNYLQGNIDAMLSLTNLFCGYNPSRVLDFYGFLGLGGTLGYHNKQANLLSAAGRHFDKLWSGKKLFFDMRGGLGVNINLSKVVAINLEANANMLPDGFNSKKGSNRDWQFNALAGLTISFGRTKTRVIETVETVTTVSTEPQPAPAPAPEPAKPVVAPAARAPQPAVMEQDIFFKINSSTISDSESSKIDALAAFLKEHPAASVKVTGYADKATGTAAYNMAISHRRAISVADALRAAGIADTRISVEYLGDTEQPFTDNARNRVAIAVAE